MCEVTIKDKKDIIVDTHSHLGYCRGWIEATLPEYIKLMECEGIDIGFLFPIPWKLNFETKSELYLNWRYNDGKTEYYSTILRDLVNPYKNINSYISDIINSYKGDKEIYLFL